MKFSWVAVIALWTLLSGPIFGPPARSVSRSGDQASASAVKPTPVKSPTTRR